MSATAKIRMTSSFAIHMPNRRAANNGRHSFAMLLSAPDICGKTNDNNSRHYSSARGSNTQSEENCSDNSVPENILQPSQIPSLPMLPFFGSIFSQVRHKDFDKDRMYKCLHAMHRELGPVFKVIIPTNPPAVFFSQPEDFKKMLAETESNPYRGAFHALKSIRDNADGDFFQKKAGILHENNYEWRRVRSNVQTPILKIQNVEQYLGTMDEVALDFVERIADENVRAAEKSLASKGLSKHKLTILETYLLTKELTRVDIITFMTDLFIAGIDTTSHTVAFTLYLLSKNPEKLRILQIHLDKILGDGKSPITSEQLAAMSYLKYCAKESLRLFPVAIALPRIFPKDIVINKYLIPKGWQGICLSALVGSSESKFQQPERFIPERWQRNRPNGIIHPYAALPFSHGTRSCVGRRIAEQEMYTLLARICHQFNIEYNYDDLDPFMHIVLTPDKPLKFKFTNRK